MKSQLAYCSACDRDVQIVITDDPSHDGHANLHESEVICLEIGHQCTGNLCPVGAAPPVVMAARLVRNGLQTTMQPIVSAPCVDCGHATSQVIVEPARMMCTECGGITERVESPGLQ